MEILHRTIGTGPNYISFFKLLIYTITLMWDVRVVIALQELAILLTAEVARGARSVQVAQVGKYGHVTQGVLGRPEGGRGHVL